MSLNPDFSPALRRLRGLAIDDPVNLAKALDHVAKAGLPLLVCEIDHLATEAAGNLVFSYKLSDQIEVSLSAIRAGN